MRWLFALAVLLPGLAWAETCGDGKVEGAEECDDGSANSEFGPCLPGCKKAVCGDGVLSLKEMCDDGNAVDGDGCSAACVPEAKPKPAAAQKAPAPKPAFDYRQVDTPEPAAGKSPSRAFELAVVGTLSVPIVGFTVGPSLGHFYAGEIGRGIGMSVARTALLIGAGSAIVRAPQSTNPGALRAIGLVSFAAVDVLVLIDLLDASNAVRRQGGRAP